MTSYARCSQIITCRVVKVLFTLWYSFYAGGKQQWKEKREAENSWRGGDTSEDSQESGTDVQRSDINPMLSWNNAGQNPLNELTQKVIWFLVLRLGEQQGCWYYRQIITKMRFTLKRWLMLAYTADIMTSPNVLSYANQLMEFYIHYVDTGVLSIALNIAERRWTCNCVRCL